VTETPSSDQSIFLLRAEGVPEPTFGPEPQSWLVWRVDSNGQRDEQHGSVELSHEGMDALHRLKSNTGVLASLDPYGETILEPRELADVIRELEGIVRLAHDESARAGFVDFVRYLRESEERGLSVCFCGD